MLPEMPSPPPLDPLDAELENITKRIRRMLTLFVIAFAFVIVAYVVSTIVVLTTESGLEGRASCEVTYNHQYAQVQKIRSGLTDDSNTAVEELINGVFTQVPGETRTQQAARFEHEYAQFKAAEKYVDRQRATHPVPAVPSC